MKSYKDFLTEKKMPSSPVGRARALKSAGQNDENRAKKYGPAEKGGAIVKHKNQIAKDKAAEMQANKEQGKIRSQSGSAGTPKLSPRKPKQPNMSAMRARSLQSQKDKAAQEKFDKKNSGFMSGVKSALGGDSFRRKDPNDKEYNKIVDKKNAEAKKEAGKNLVKGAVGTAKNVAGKMVPKTGGQLGVSQGSSIV